MHPASIILAYFTFSLSLFGTFDHLTHRRYLDDFAMDRYFVHTDTHFRTWTSVDLSCGNRNVTLGLWMPRGPWGS